MSDLISRADAIESMANAIWHYPNELYADLNDYNMAEALAKDGLMSVTSQNLTKPNKTCEVDLINRADAINVMVDAIEAIEKNEETEVVDRFAYPTIKDYAEEAFSFTPSVSAERVGEWIPCSERLPSDDEIVNITWVNHNPPPYYADIGEKPFVASGLRYRGKWYWYSSVCQDSHQDFDLIDKDIEVIAWQPLPKPYECGAKMKGGAK